MNRPDIIAPQPRHRLESRSSLYGMGIDHRVVSAKMEGPWTPNGKSHAWKLYKEYRRHQDRATPPP